MSATKHCRGRGPPFYGTNRKSNASMIGGSLNSVVAEHGGGDSSSDSVVAEERDQKLSYPFVADKRIYSSCCGVFVGFLESFAVLPSRP